MFHRKLLTIIYPKHSFDILISFHKISLFENEVIEQKKPFYSRKQATDFHPLAIKLPCAEECRLANNNSGI